MSDTWLRYWQGTPDNDYLTVEANVVAEHVIAHFEVSPQTSILDFGCGYGHVAARLAEHAGHVFLWDAVPHVLASAADRVAAPNVSIAQLDQPGEHPSVDLIVVNSVIQYMNRRSLSAWMSRWREIIGSEGALLLSDVPTKEPSLLRQTWEWFKLTGRAGKLISAIRFSFQNASRYAEARRQEPLNVHTRKDIEAMADEAGIAVTTLEHNLAFQPQRVSFVLRSLAT